MAKKTIKLDEDSEEMQQSVYDQLEREEDFILEQRGEKKIRVKFGSWWPWGGKKKGTAEIKFDKQKEEVRMDFSFVSDLMISSVLIYFPLILIVLVFGVGGTYPVVGVGLIILALYAGYHYSTMQKTAKDYVSKLNNIFHVVQSDEVDFCPNCGEEVELDENGERKECPVCMGEE